MDIAIVGAGLAGLTAAHDLVRSGLRPTIFDGAAEAGGQIRTLRERGFLVEHGAEGFVTADPAVPELCRELGIGDQIIPQVELRSLLYRNGSLSELGAREAATILGIPTPDESGPRGISALRNGMSALTDALVDAISGKGDLRLGNKVDRIARDADQWQVTLSNGHSERAKWLILAVPPPAAAALLATMDREAALLLGGIALNSNLSVTLAYARADIRHPLAASGLVVATGETGADGLRACVFSSSKFADRAPAGFVLLRAFFRPDAKEMKAQDQDWVKDTTDILGPIIGISGQPVGYWVSRWPEAIPEAQGSHWKTMSQLELRVNGLGRVGLAGSAYQTGGIPGAVRSGRAAARRFTESLPA